MSEAKEGPNPHRVNKVFTAHLKIVQDCADELNEAEVKQWLEEYFSGSDLGDVTVLEVKETTEEA